MRQYSIVAFIGLLVAGCGRDNSKDTAEKRAMHEGTAPAKGHESELSEYTGLSETSDQSRGRVYQIRPPKTFVPHVQGFMAPRVEGTMSPSTMTIRIYVNDLDWTLQKYYEDEISFYTRGAAPPKPDQVKINGIDFLIGRFEGGMTCVAFDGPNRIRINYVNASGTETEYQVARASIESFRKKP